MKNNNGLSKKVTRGDIISQEILDALAKQCSTNFMKVKESVVIDDRMGDDILRKIGPTTNDIAEMCIINVYQARYYLLKLMQEGLVIKTSAKKGYPLHWWLVGADK